MVGHASSKRLHSSPPMALRLSHQTGLPEGPAGLAFGYLLHVWSQVGAVEGGQLMGKLAVGGDANLPTLLVRRVSHQDARPQELSMSNHGGAQWARSSNC